MDIETEINDNSGTEYFNINSPADSGFYGAGEVETGSLPDEIPTEIFSGAVPDKTAEDYFGGTYENPFIRVEESEEYKKLEKEYKEYRTKKVLAKIDGLITGLESAADIRNDFRKLSQEARAKVVTLPCLIPAAKRQLPQIVKIETLIDYPYGGGSRKAVLCEIREASRQKASVAVCLNLSDFSSGNTHPLEKKLKTLKKLSGKVSVTPMFPVCTMGSDKATRLALIIKLMKFEKVKLVLDKASDIGKTADAVKIFYDTLGEQCPVEVVGEISTAEDAETLFNAGADRIITTDYRTLSRQRLDGLDV